MSAFTFGSGKLVGVYPDGTEFVIGDVLDMTMTIEGVCSTCNGTGVVEMNEIKEKTMIRPDVDEMIAFLNELARIDPYAMARLIAARVPCNSSMADHPTVQTGERYEESGGAIGGGPPRRTVVGWEVGFLGIINGFYGVYDDGAKRSWGAIAAVINASLASPHGCCHGFVKLENASNSTENEG